MKLKHKANLFRGAEPKWVRCYDNEGQSFDQWFVVFSGVYTRRTGGEHWGLGMSEYPCHPQGFGIMSFSQRQFDYPRYSHLGRKITFDKLPRACRDLVMRDYCYLWDTLPPSGAENAAGIEREIRHRLASHETVAQATA